jgi:hypothetical protein
MNANTQRELEDRIASFARDITAILQRAVADSVGGALGGGGGRSARAAKGGRGKKAGRAAKGGRGGGGPSDEQVLREVTKEGGRRITQIAEAMGVQSADIVKQLKRLVADKKVRTTGQRRGTKYKAV